MQDINKDIDGTSLFWPAETYQLDLPLFDRLGLKPFKTSTRGRIHVGTVIRDGTTVDISVICAPAQFWAFHINNAGDGSPKRRYAITTGSGALVDYWPFIEQILDGMIVVESAELA